jgi:hypothetical protein
VVRRLARGLVALAAFAMVVGFVSGAAASPVVNTAEQASSAGWRVSQVLAGVTVGGLWAGSARDAWLAGDECADPATCGEADTGNGTVVVRHWDGTAWQVVTPPSAYVDSPLDQGVAAVAATSGSNAWVLASRGADEVAYTDALHLTGKSWAAPVRLDAAIATAVAPCPTQLWAFGEPPRSGPPGYFAHFNGRTWREGSFPFSGTASAARSASDVWVGGGGDGTAPLGIEHWDGRRWHVTPLPDLGVPSSDLLWANVNGLADAGPGDAWADITTQDDGGANRAGTILLRWNGRAWSRVAFPYGGSALSPVAADGHGGIWLATANSAGDNTTTWFDHYFGGRWTRVRVPSRDGEQPEVVYLSSIPGTPSLWAAGGVHFADDGEAMLAYGGETPLLRPQRSEAGHSGRVRMSATEAPGPRARPILVQPQFLKAACAAAAPGGSLTVARSSARPSRMSPWSSAAMPWRRQELRTSSWVSAKVRPGCSSVTAAGSGAVRSRHQSVDGRSGIPQA